MFDPSLLFLLDFISVSRKATEVQLFWQLPRQAVSHRFTSSHAVIAQGNSNARRSQRAGAALKSLPMGNNERGEANVELPAGLVALLAAPACLCAGRCFPRAASTENCVYLPCIFAIYSDILLRQMPTELTNAAK